MKRLAWWLVLAALAGCATPTEFTGKPKFPGGLEGCRAACSKDGLEMGAFVYSGEYSTSCVCRPPTQASPAAGAGTAADAAPTAGVEVQTQAAAAAAAANNARSRQSQQQSSSGASRH
jgi:hypothetical protein